MEDSREIEVKGYKMLVSRDGTITLPAKETTYTCIRLGAPSTKTAVFKERVLRPTKNNMGYLEVCFSHKRKTFKMGVHRLVALAFVSGYEDGLVVNHLNGDKLDNRPENLEWTTKGENTKHAWATGLIDLRGENQPGRKLTNQQVSYIRRLLAQGVSANALAVVAGVSSSLICLIRDGQRWAGVEAAREV